MKLVSEGVLEKVKHSFRLSPKSFTVKEKDKARAKEESQRKVAGGGASGSKQQVRRGEKKREERKMAPVVGVVSASGAGVAA